jgi:hypothetical protein
MRLAEIDGKALLRRHGLAARVAFCWARTPPCPPKPRNGLDTCSGAGAGRRPRQRGLVRRLADVAEFASARQRITAALGDLAAPLLLEEAVTIAREI